MNIGSSKFLLISLASLIVLSGVMGWFVNELWREYSDYRVYNGLYIKNMTGKAETLAMAKDFDKYGNWICVNIKGMSVEEAFNTCRHEVGHEIFAKYCEDNLEKCLEVTGE